MISVGIVAQGCGETDGSAQQQQGLWEVDGVGAENAGQRLQCRSERGGMAEGKAKGLLSSGNFVLVDLGSGESDKGRGEEGIGRLQTAQGGVGSGSGSSGAATCGEESRLAEQVARRGSTGSGGPRAGGCGS